MTWPRPSQRVCELIREAARICLLDVNADWIEEVDRVTMAAHPVIASDPVLMEVVRRANRAHHVQWSTANLREPGAPVPPNLGDEAMAMARDMVRRGLGLLAIDVYRAAEQIAFRRWMEIIFDLTTDAEELHELLDVSIRSINNYIDTTFTGIAAHMRKEHEELVRESGMRHLTLVKQILEMSAIDSKVAAAQLGYRLEQTHTAAVLWSDDLDSDYESLDRATRALCVATASQQLLTIVPGAVTRWLWLADATAPDLNELRQAVSKTPAVRVAIGTAAKGIEGFRRSHHEALSTQSTMARLHANHQVASFADVQLVSLMAASSDDVSDFITSTLGDLKSASPQLREALLTYINEQCSSSRAAKRLYTHRNTLVRKIETAQHLLPRPLDTTSVHVAVALEALQWMTDCVSTSAPQP